WQRPDPPGPTLQRPSSRKRRAARSKFMRQPRAKAEATKNAPTKTGLEPAYRSWKGVTSGSRGNSQFIAPAELGTDSAGGTLARGPASLGSAIPPGIASGKPRTHEEDENASD